MKRSRVVPSRGRLVAAVFVMVALVTAVGWQQPRGLAGATPARAPPALAPPGPGQPPTLHEGLGDVRLPSSCTAQAQTEPDRAVTLLRSFWRGPALQAFGRVAELDAGRGGWQGRRPSCGRIDHPGQAADALGEEAT